MIELPQHAYRFFWDVDPLTLDVATYRRYVVERLLELGDLPAVRWMLATFSPPEIVDVLKTSRRLSRLSANFWALYFGVNKEDLPCFSTPSHPEHEAIWPY
jgi:hypothetical protein